ncbi:MAG: hypothetical protein Q8K24_05915 [Hydrogenophaga sp.]|nr:hypothetical protein [Hydrogenophaga sp.]
MTLLQRAADIAAEIDRRCRTITRDAGAETDVGVRVLRGRRKIDDDKVPCVVIVEGLDAPVMGDSKRSATAKVRQGYVLVGYDKCDPDHPNDKAHAVIRDFKRAIFGDGTTLGERVMSVTYKGRDIGPRGDGVSIVSATVEFEVEFSERLDQP